MKLAVICLTAASGLAGVGAAAQAVGDPLEKLAACTQLPYAERRDCLDKLARDLEPDPAPSSAAPAVPSTSGQWIVSETTSPLDYSPVAVATTTSDAAPGSNALQLSIQCRGGRTELLLRAAGITRRAEDYVVSYSINDGRPVILAAGAPTSGTGIAVRGDVVRLLTSLPDQGAVTFGVTARQGPSVEGRYDLAGLQNVMGRLAASCKWPVGGQRK